MKSLLSALIALPLACVAADPVALHWLDAAPPSYPDGVTWGVPWPKGAVQPTDTFALTAAGGRALAVQTWPLAYWPDGSVKWSGHAVAADSNARGPLTLSPGKPAAPAAAVRVNETADAVEIDAGLVRARLPRHGSALIETLAVGPRVVARNGRLIVQREDRSRAAQHVVAQEDFVSEVESVAVEQAGPVHAVVKITGRHRGATGPRAWLPFTVRLSFFAQSPAIRLTHSFVFDGDPATDFIRGLGVAFDVPFKEELHNRHFRIAGDAEGGVWRQPVRMLPGFRAQAGRGVTDAYEDNLEGKPLPPLERMDERTRAALQTMPIWGDVKLTQSNANGWSLFKRTTADASWLHVTDGRRARGLAMVGDTSGALAIGVKDFWQKAPAALEITGGATAQATITAWLWSPDAPAMDLRRYDEIPHGLAVNYEDWKPGWGTAHGVANTHDLTLWALGAIPGSADLAAMAVETAAPPVVVAAPEYYHALHVFGNWSLPDSSTPTTRWLEGQVQGLVDYYHAQVEQRSWYGFWDFGDVMHNYDYGRHDWRYDVGGWAWANTELMPDMLLWYSFLRTGRPDLFRFAEAMTRHTSEVDVYHVGPFAPLGSRHNVNHWGDGAKQPRVSHAGLKQFYYFLSGGDGRVGDLLREQIDADLTYSYLQQFNGSHYVPAADGTPKLDARASEPAPRPEQFAPRPTAAQRQPATRFGLEWMCYAMNWMVEWERGGDQRWRSHVEAEMRSMAKNVDAQGRFPGRYFDVIFGGPENMAEMEPMYDVPEFWQAWANTCEAIGRAVEGGQMTGPRMLAYAARQKQSAELGRMAWDKLISPDGTLPPANQPKSASGPALLRPVTDPEFLGGPVGWQLHGVASVQWALNAIETLELAKPYLADWEKSHAR